MKLYAENYFSVTPEDKAKLAEIKKKEKTESIRGFRRPLNHLYPKSVRHNESYFPNNFLDAYDINAEKDNMRIVLEEYKKVIDLPDSNERTTQKFIRKNRAYFIIGSVLKWDYNFGHHGLYIFPEFPLSSQNNVDYLVIGRRTGGFEYVFVELEAIYGQIIIKGGNFGAAIRKGISQVEDWNIWIEKNYSCLFNEFAKHSNKEADLPLEFRELDKTRIHYCIISGRRKDFDEKSYNLRRRSKKERDILILHYDNLYDYSRDVIKNGNY